MRRQQPGRSRVFVVGTGACALARVEIMQYFRAERRRLSREAEVGQKPRRNATLNEWQVGVILDEFNATLTPGEQRFMDEYLLSLPQEGEDAEGADGGR